MQLNRLEARVACKHDAKGKDGILQRRMRVLRQADERHICLLSFHAHVQQL